MKHPSAVTACNLDLENLITDSNRSIATLAITTLLKTGSESSVDRLMKQISSFVSEISDEFKVGRKRSPSRLVDLVCAAVPHLCCLCVPQVVVVQAISALCQKYPRKHSVMMNFLSNMLRDDVSLLRRRRISSLPPQRWVTCAKADLYLAGRLRVQARHRGLHHQHHRGEPGEQGDGFGSSVRVHRGLRAHGAGHQNPAPAGQGGPAHPPAVQVHPLHFQPGGAGERSSSCR